MDLLSFSLKPFLVQKLAFNKADNIYEASLNGDVFPE